MGQRIEHPVTVYQRWFAQIPEAHRRRLAKGFWLCTTESTADMALSHEQALCKFVTYLQRPDFPLRVVSKMIVVRGMTSFLLANREVLEQENIFARDKEINGKVLDMTPAMWKKTWTSWQRIIAHELSDPIFAAWTRQAMNT